MDNYVPSDQEAEDAFIPSEDDAASAPTALESMIHGFVNNIPLGPQAAAAADALLHTGHKGSYSENLADYNQKFSEAKKEHPVAYGTGAVSGSVAPAFLPGVGEAMEAAPVTSGAALGAANALSNRDLTKDLKGNLIAGGTGAALGAGTSYALGKLFPKGENLEKFANNKAVQSTGLAPKYLEELKPQEMQDIGEFARQNNLVGMDKEEMLANAKSLQDEIGKKIGNIGKQVVGNLDDRDKVSAIYPLLEEGNKYAGLANREAKTLARSYKAGVTDILNLGDSPTWDAVQTLKKQYGNIAFSDTGEIKDQAAKDVYFKLSDMLKKMADRAQEDPNLSAEYKQALLNYHRIDPIVEGFKTEVGRQRAGMAGHGVGHGFIPRIIRSLPGQDNPAINLGTAAAVSTVAPHLGPLLALPTFINPAIQSKVASGVQSALPTMKKGINQALIDYLVSQYGGK